MDKDISILVVDDEEIVRESLKEWLLDDGYKVDTAEDGFQALAKMREKPYDIAIIDLKMPKMDGLELMERMKEVTPETKVIMITAYATVHTAVQAIKMGAYDYLVKPCNPEEISLLIQRLIESQSLVKEVTYLRKRLEEQYRFHDLVSKSHKMQKIFEFAKTIANSSSNVLILGESGTGKELLARAIHNEGPRAKYPFVAVSCVALPETLLESELFGHEKGAFTDAIAQKKGKFEIADKGTIFLDEIGDISPKLQLSLLRVIQEKEIVRVGGEKPIKLDVRIIAATNRDLKKLVHEGKFREDLYYRLNVITIEIPPLRERKEDIPVLVNHFIEKFNVELKKNVQKVSEDAMKMLVKYNWPGNVRELENVIERAMVVCKDNIIRKEDIGVLDKDEEYFNLPDKTLRSVEREHILRVLKENDWNIQRSAEILGIDRATLYNKIKKYNLKQS
ncbi:MAG: sigma-54 dependent transcriptional regulator [Desulfobacterota bacterium]|nr:sigma-54 dependent transcriptional regulator [Thermodesulfobacteriota bacterium]MDW8001314.1 sigma-54 dependent transcriptional regulator [Deltaproteobacteria bacterium]